MTHLLKILTLCPLLLGGCSYLGSFSSNNRMAYSTSISDIPYPGQDEALVFFIRDKDLHGWALLSVIYDGDKFVGIVPHNTIFPHYAPAGEHLFMIYADAAGSKPVARFIKANVHEGKTYVISIYPSTVSLSGGFQFGDLYSGDLWFENLPEWIQDVQVIENNAQAYAWAEINHQKILKTKAQCLKKYLKKNPPSATK